MPDVVLKSAKINEEGARSIYLSCTGILSEMLYKVLLKYNQCQVNLMLLNS